MPPRTPRDELVPAIAVRPCRANHASTFLFIARGGSSTRMFGVDRGCLRRDAERCHESADFLSKPNDFTFRWRGWSWSCFVAIRESISKVRRPPNAYVV